MKLTKGILSLSLLLMTSISYARHKQIVVAVIDTGINADYKNASFLCKDGHKDLTGTGLDDHHGHGTNISGLIDQYAKGVILSKDRASIGKLLSSKANYCQVIIKYWDPGKESGVDLEIEAIKYAINLHVDIINMSGGGESYSKEEALIVKKALNKGIKFVAAAGNDHADMNTKYKYYPACSDKRVIVVGNLGNDGQRLPSSNYGSVVKNWEHGYKALSLMNADHMSVLTGTSQATAIKTGKIVKQMLSH